MGGRRLILKAFRGKRHNSELMIDNIAYVSKVFCFFFLKAMQVLKYFFSTLLVKNLTGDMESLL